MRAAGGFLQNQKGNGSRNQSCQITVRQKDDAGRDEQCHEKINRFAHIAHKPRQSQSFKNKTRAQNGQREDMEKSRKTIPKQQPANHQ